MLLQVSRTESPSGFRLVGEVDISNVSSLRDAVSPAVEAGGDVTLDLAGLAFMDSTGIQVLIEMSRGLGDRGTLRLIGLGDLVRRTLERVRLQQLSNVEIVDDEHDATG